LARKINANLAEIEDIESGKELFLPVVLRQKLARGLKCSIEEIKSREKTVNNNSIGFETVYNLKEEILKGNKDLLCPRCGEKLITSIIEMYDLEDNKVYHPKAHCSKCVFQIKN